MLGGSWLHARTLTMKIGRKKGLGGEKQQFIQHEIKTRASNEQLPALAHVEVSRRSRIEVAAELKINAIAMCSCSFHSLLGPNVSRLGYFDSICFAFFGHCFWGSD